MCSLKDSVARQWDKNLLGRVRCRYEGMVEGSAFIVTCMQRLNAAELLHPEQRKELRGMLERRLPKPPELVVKNLKQTDLIPYGDYVNSYD